MIYQTPMKKLVYLSLFITLLAACSQQSVKVEGELGTLIQKRDSIKAMKDSISTVLAAYEAKIAALDTNKKLQLVTLQETKTQTFEHYFTVYGEVNTDRMAMVNTETQGKLESIKVQEGDRVSKGQVLAVQNADVIRKNIAELENRLELAQTVFERQERLWKKNIGSEIEYLRAKNDRDALKKSLQTAQEQLSMAVVKAPFSGVVDEVFPKEGELAAPGSPLLRLINLDDVYIKADVSENYIGKVKEGDTVEVKIPNADNEIIRTTVARIGDFINPANRTFKIRLNIPNKKGDLKPNMLAEIHIRDYVNDSTVVIPENLILLGAQDKRYVFVATLGEDDLAEVKKQPVQVGLMYKNNVEILKGLSGGEFIVDKGARSIQAGEFVQVTKYEEL